MRRRRRRQRLQPLPNRSGLHGLRQALQIPTCTAASASITTAAVSREAAPLSQVHAAVTAPSAPTRIPAGSELARSAAIARSTTICAVFGGAGGVSARNTQFTAESTVATFGPAYRSHGGAAAGQAWHH